MEEPSGRSQRAPRRSYAPSGAMLMEACPAVASPHLAAPAPQRCASDAVRPWSGLGATSRRTRM